MRTAQEKIREWIHTHERDAAVLLKRLIQQPSIRGKEGKTQAIIVEKCRQLGLDIDLWEIDENQAIKEHPGFHCDRQEFSGNPNLVALLKGKGKGKSIILNGHIDVVPEGNPEEWTYPPYGGIEKDGKVYGRGATDMKGGNVALLLAMEAIIRSGISLDGDVIFQSVIEEESGGAGTLAAVLRGYKADGAIIPEPTSMKIFPLQQGSSWFRIHVKGKAAHGGTRYEGRNAIDLAAEVMQEIKILEEKRNDGLRKDPLYKSTPIPVPINVGSIRGGNWPSSVPEVCVLEGRYGISPYESVEDALQEFEEMISSLNDRHEWFKDKPLSLEWFGARWLPGNLEQGHPLLESLRKRFSDVLGCEPVIEASPWGTDGGILSSYGNTPVLVFGPGQTDKAHETDEYIELGRLVEAAEIIALTILDWCGYEEGAEY